MEATKVKQVPKLLYTGKTLTTGGRQGGTSRSSDGNLDIRFSEPGTNGAGTNPEQLFAAGWSACFEGAIVIVARKRLVDLLEHVTINAEVGLFSYKDVYYLEGKLSIHIPRIEKNIAQELIDEARQVCPYTKAIQGNMKVVFAVV